MTDEIVGKIVEAYKTSPLLTGLLLLNVVLFIGMGWYILEIQKASGAFVQALQKDVLDLAKNCK